LYNIENNATCIFNTEQGLRETTLKAYRYAIVDGGALGVMTSYEGFGAEHAETTEALLTGVLRREWDFKGAVTSDYVSYPDKAAVFEGFIRAGGNLGMNMALTATSSEFNSTASNRYQNRLKDAAKEVLWTWLRAEYHARDYKANPDMDDSVGSVTIIPSWVWWKPVLTTFNAVAIIGLAFWLENIILDIFLPKEEVEVGGN
jgi:beta-glucosidase